MPREILIHQDGTQAVRTALLFDSPEEAKAYERRRDLQALSVAVGVLGATLSIIFYLKKHNH